MRSLKVLAAAVSAAFVLAGSASATTMYPDVDTGYWTWSGIQETSNSGDPEPLFGAPGIDGDDLAFFPADFTAFSIGGAGDYTGAQLQLMVEGNSLGQFIESLSITEFGDAVLAGLGTAATGTFASMAGFVTVLEANNTDITDVVIPFSGTFSPSNTLTLPSNPGTTLWSGTVTVDIASVVANATKVMLSFDNDLFAFSEASSSAKIQKKVVDGPSLVVSVPEPGALALLALGFLSLGLRVRRS